MPPKKTKRLAGARATATAADAAAAPADTAAPPADASAPPVDAAAPPPIEPYFGAHGEATIRAASLPRLPGFEAFRATNSATAPPLLSTAAQSTAAGRRLGGGSQKEE